MTLRRRAFFDAASNGIVALLPPGGRDGWSAADRFDARAGIVEFDGGLRMAEPQRRALAGGVLSRLWRRRMAMIRYWL